MHDIQLEKLRCMPTAMHCWTVNSDAMLATIVQPLIFNRKLQRLRQHVPQLLLYRLFDLFALHVTCSETADTTRSMVLHFLVSSLCLGDCIDMHRYLSFCISSRLIFFVITERANSEVGEF